MIDATSSKIYVPSLSTRPLKTCRHILTSARSTNITMMLTWLRSGVLTALVGLPRCLALMAVTDENLQKLGKPPMSTGKEDEWTSGAS